MAIFYSDGPESKTFSTILDDTLDKLEEEAEEQGVNKTYLLQQLVKRSKLKWKADDISTSTTSTAITVEAATALIYNLDLSINKYQVNIT